MILKRSNALPQYGFSQQGSLGCLVHLEHNEIQAQWFNNLNEQPFSLAQPARLIWALPHNVIWRKTYFFPHHLNETQCHQNVIQILRQELPTPLEDLHFDYQIRPLEQAQRVAIFAVRKSFLPSTIKNAIFDCELHCMIRALHYLHQIPLEESEKYSYAFQNKYIQHQKEGIKLTHLRDQSNTLLAFQSEHCENETYLIALGAALWNGMA